MNMGAHPDPNGHTYTHSFTPIRTQIQWDGKVRPGKTGDDLFKGNTFLEEGDL